MKPECKLIGKDGNVFNLIGIVRTTLKKNELLDELQQFNIAINDLMKNGGNYDDVLVMFSDFVDIV